MDLRARSPRPARARRGRLAEHLAAAERRHAHRRPRLARARAPRPRRPRRRTDSDAAASTGTDTHTRRTDERSATGRLAHRARRARRARRVPSVVTARATRRSTAPGSRSTTTARSASRPTTPACAWARGRARTASPGPRRRPNRGAARRPLRRGRVPRRRRRGGRGARRARAAASGASSAPSPAGSSEHGRQRRARPAAQLTLGRLGREPAQPTAWQAARALAGPRRHRLQLGRVLGPAALEDPEPLRLARRHQRAARVEPAPGRDPRRVGRLARGGSAAPCARSRARRSAAPACTDAAGPRAPPRSCRPRRCGRGTSPRSRSAMFHASPRSWVTTSIATPVSLHEPEHQPQDLAAHRRVEARDRLVGDDQRRLEHHRARDHDALALPAGDLVRIALEEPLGRAQPRARPSASATSLLVRPRPCGCAAPRRPTRRSSGAGSARRSGPGRRSARCAGTSRSAPTP